jgi:hypothetical protein
VSEAGQLETRKEGLSGGEANYWAQQLELANDDHRDFIKDGKGVIARYKAGSAQALKQKPKRFNILYSNTETLKAAIFVRMAKPDIRRRFADRDPIGRQVAEIIERAATYCNDSYDAEKEHAHAVEDYLLAGRGIVRVQYDAETDGKVVTKQELKDKYVKWDDFRHEPARVWSDVSWIAFRHKMSREDLKANKFNDAETVPLNWSPQAANDGKEKPLPDSFKRAEVWEIWDKTNGKRIWIVMGHPNVLRTDDDPYGLEGFYPIAEPLQATTANDTFIPESEFQIYKDQADGLDEIEARIDRLTKALKRRGVYDATFKELARLAKANDNEFVPVKNYADLSNKGGLAAAFQAEDLKSIADALLQLHTQRDLRVQTIYEVVGIADVMRGSSDPRETLGAQKIKAQFGGNRLKKRQDKVQKWVRDTMRLKAEILAEHFEPQKLAEMTGFQLVETPQPGPNGQPQIEGTITPEMIQVLRSDKLRSYRVDIETDSTVFEDAENEKQARVELITAMTGYLEKSIPAVQAVPELAPLTFETLAFGMRAFKAGKSLEEVIDQTRDQILEKIKNPQPPPPDPKVEAEKIKAEAVQQKAQIDAQTAQQKAQLDQQKMVMELQRDQQKHSMEMEKMQAELAMMRQELGMKAQEMQLDAQMGEQKMAQEREQMALDAERSEREHEMSIEAGEHKHKLGMEAMEAKAKQAKAKPAGAKA